MGRRKVVILGSTGSIGRSALEVVGAFPDRFEVLGLATRSRGRDLAAQVAAFRPRVVCLVSEAGIESFLQAGPHPDVDLWEGEEGLLRLAGHPDADIVVNGLVGAAGLRPTLAALEAGRELALANKESLVLAGEIVMDLARRKGLRIRPVDSELSALGQCLDMCGTASVRRVFLTASGGPFWNLGRADLEHVTAADALRHPVWDMGPRITVDSATMMNKGFEILETHWLFGFPVSDIGVLVHPQSVVHAIVEFVDGFSLPLLAPHDMRLPIQYSLTAPERMPTRLPRLDLAGMGSLTFEAPDPGRFPCLDLAREAGEMGATYPAVLNAADEMAVAAFLDGRIRFVEIPRVIESCLSLHTPVEHPGVDEILEADAWARTACRDKVGAGS
jgi:1-deoxy-D-xylulose-5-phosphate reductoisomerase